MSKYLILLIVSQTIISLGNFSSLQLSNYPTYFYGHYCDLTINYTLPSTSKFANLLLYIQNTSTNVGFSSNFRPYTVHLPNMTDIVPYVYPPCYRGSNQLFQCLTFSQPYMHVISSQEKMVSFTLHNVVCPSSPNMNKTDFSLRVEYIEGSSHEVIETDNANFSFSGLQFRVIEDLRINLDITENIQILNYEQGCYSQLSFSFIIRNQTQLSSWRQFSLTFLEGFSNVQIQTGTCKLGIQNGTNQPFDPSVAQNYSQLVLQPINCSLSSNILTMRNSYFNPNSSILNHQFTPYSVFTNPPSRYTFQLHAQISGNFQIKIQIKSESNFKIKEDGELQIIEQAQQIIYFHRVANFFTVNSSEEVPMMKCLQRQYNIFDKFANLNIGKILIDNRMIIFPATIAIFAILLMTVRSELFKLQKYGYIVLIFSDFLIKIGLLGLSSIEFSEQIKQIVLLNWDQLNLQIKQIGDIIYLLAILQFVALNLLFFSVNLILISYWGRKMNQKMYQYDQSKQKQWKANKFIVFCMFLNHKFVLTLLQEIQQHRLSILHDKGQQKIKTYMLFFNHCANLLAEIILLFGFCLYVNSMQVHLVSIAYVCHQLLLIILMILGFRHIYTIGQYLKAYHVQNEEIPIEEKEHKGTDDRRALNREIEIQEKKVQQ